MFCSKCGKEINENEKFCSECGNAANQTISDSIQTETHYEATNSQLNSFAKKSKKLKKVLLIILAILFSFIVFILVISSSDEDVSEPKPTGEASENAISGDYSYVKLPLYFMNDEEYRSWKESIANNTYNGNIELTDEFLIMKVKSENLDTLKTSMIEETNTKFKEFANSKSFETIRNIIYDEDFKSATIIAASNYPNSDDSVVIRKVGDSLSQIRAMFYDDFSSEIEITVKDSTGKIFDVVEYEHPTKRATELSAKKLIGAYTTNEVAARRLYEGKYVCVTGLVESIGEDITGTIYITLSNGDDWSMEYVQCYFSEDYANEIATLVKGDSVTVYGTQTDYIFNVMVEDCVLNTN